MRLTTSRMAFRREAVSWTMIALAPGKPVAAPLLLTTIERTTGRMFVTVA